MYNHREEKRRVDVVDLDPYGTAAPFIDAAVQCVNDGGKINGLLVRIHGANSSTEVYYALHVQISLFLQRRISLKNGDAYLVHNCARLTICLKFFELRWYSCQG